MKFYRKFVILRAVNTHKNSDDVSAFEKNRRSLLKHNSYGLLNTQIMISDLIECGVAIDRLNKKLNMANETITNYFVQENRQSDTIKKISLETDNIKLKNEIKVLNEIVENSKELIVKLSKDLCEAENKIKKGALTKVVARENFFSQLLDDYINKRFELIKDIDVNKNAEAFNIKSFEQLENENKSLRGQIKKQASVIKDLKSIKSKSRIEENKTNSYVEKLALKNSSLNDKLIHQSKIIGELMEFKQLYQDGIFVKTSPEQVGIVTIAQDELNNLRAFKKEIVEILVNESGGLTTHNKIVDMVRKYEGGNNQ